MSMKWPAYNKDEGRYLIWKYPMTSLSVEENLRAKQCDFWNIFMPNLLNTFSNCSDCTTGNAPPETRSSIIYYIIILPGILLVML